MKRGPRLTKKQKVEIITGAPIDADNVQLFNYCRQKGISMTSFYRWRKRFKKIVNKPVEQPKSLVEHIPSMQRVIKRHNEYIAAIAEIATLQKENNILKDKIISLFLTNKI